MEILFRRDQSKGATGNVKFKLWSKIELDENEAQAVKHYAFDDAVLIDSWQPELIRNSIYIGLAVSVAVFAMVSALLNFEVGLFFGLLAGCGVGYIYYDKNRETIFVKDLLHGRYFDCASVIELARKEAWLETITGFLRQVMESAKHWDGTEARPIEVLPKAEAKRLIIKGL